MSSVILGKTDAGSFTVETHAEVFEDGSAWVSTRVARPVGAPQPSGTRDNAVWLSAAQMRRLVQMHAKAVV